MSKTKSRTVIGAILALTLIGAACGSSAKTTTGTTAGAGATTTAAGATTSAAGATTSAAPTEMT
jgi:hypothetical protein